MRLIVGLGNPGPGYAGHRHNVGFMAADAIVRRHDLTPGRTRFHANIAEGEVTGERVLVLKPRTYMNESGLSVGEALHFFKLEASEIIVIHDEIDLTFGKLRVKHGGGAAGHNGLRSIDAHIGSDYWRVRLGVGHPGHKDLVHDHVLRDFLPEERALLETMTAAVAEHIGLLLKGDDSAFMSKVAQALQPPKETRPAPTVADDPNPKKKSD